MRGIDIKIKLVVIVLLTLVQWYAHGSGLLVTPDSTHYIHASLSFKENLSLIDSDGNHLLFWPPLYPVLLAITGLGKLTLVIVNLFVSILIAIVIFSLTSRVIKNKFFRFFCCINILLGIHLLLISTFVWSELIFLLLMLIFVDQLIKYSAHEKSIYPVIIIGFLMCLQRNAGLFIVAVAALYIFLKEDRWLQKFKKSIFFFMITCSGSLCWNIYAWFFVPRKHFNFEDKLFQPGSLNF